MIPRHAKPSVADDVALSSALLHRRSDPGLVSPINPSFVPSCHSPLASVIPQSPICQIARDRPHFSLPERS